MRKPLLLELLKELETQIHIVEPHSDADWDCVAHENACCLISYLIKYADGKADLRPIKKAYLKHKIEPAKDNFIEPERGSK